MNASYVGPALLAGAIAYVYHLNHLAHDAGVDGSMSKPLLSTTSFSMMVFMVYAVGAMPRTRFFPAWWYKGNLFAVMYHYGYCSEAVGYRVLRRFMHQPQPHPHSDFRGGIRTLTQVCATPGASAPAAKLGENLDKWRPPCLEDAEDNACRLAAVAATSGNGTAVGAAPHPRSAAAAAAAALDTLKHKKSTEATAPVTATSAEEVPALFTLRGGLPIDVQRLPFRKTDRGVLVFPIPIFTDNYSYLIFSFQTKRCCLVDPADHSAVMRCLHYLKKHLSGNEEGDPEVRITDILTTHKHWDHAGGNRDLVEYATGKENREKATRNEHECAVELNVYGPAEESAHFVNKRVADGDNFTVCDGAVRIDVLSAPGHTSGSLLFVASDARAERNLEENSGSYLVRNKLAVFTGDALFSGGLGAPFETVRVAQVLKTRHSFLQAPALRSHPVTREPVPPEDVLLYVGHEYTERLMSETFKLHTRAMAAASSSRNSINGSGAPGHARMRDDVPESAKIYGLQLAGALRDVKIMRAQSDGIEDARLRGEDLVDADKNSLTPEDRARQNRLRNRIPLCTVPSSLALEKMVNPLLTVTDEALAAVPTVDGVIDTKALEQAIYLSLDRVVS